MSARDWHLEMARLRSEACENDSHDVGEGVPPYARMVCPQCIDEAALGRAYEAGGVDALAPMMNMPVSEDPAAPTGWRCPRCGYVGWSLRPGHFQRCTEKFCARSSRRTPVVNCHCVPPLFPGAPPCACCGAKAGEPCRHEVKP